jgi:hydroxyacylglutathione hydrolase
VGYITADTLTENQTLPQINVRELGASLKNDGPLVVDVRTPTEWKSGHIDGARHLPLAAFARQELDLPKDRKIAVICGSGYRSSIATSLLQARGYKDLANVSGGMTAYTESAG